MIYAGIGSRKTPPPMINKMTRIGARLAELGHTLRSGGAIGADQAFETGARGAKGNLELFFAKDATPEAIELASQFHPAWDKCSDYAQKLHGRNMMILLGTKLNTPADFILCWTPSGAIYGGTGQALRAAKHFSIPVWNLYYNIKPEGFPL